MTPSGCDSVCCFRPVLPEGLLVCWEITAKCNLHCLHCFIYPPIRKELTVERMLTAVEEMSSAGVRRVLLTGGEPLMNPHLDTVSRALSNANIIVDVNTNAMLASSERLQRLSDVGVNELTISLDGCSTETFERCRPGSNFNKIIDNMRAAVAMGFRVDSTFVPTSLNVQEFAGVARLAQELGALNLTVAGLVVFQRAQANRDWLTLNSQQTRALCEEIDRMRKELDLSIWSNRLRTDKPPTSCTAGTTIVGIDASGYMHPCPLYVLPFTSKNDLAQRAFTDIMDDETFHRPKFENMVGCAACHYVSACHGGCFGVKKKLNWPPNGPDPICNMP